jgi:hypothetical protein
MSAQIIEEDQERRAADREEARRKQEGEREGLREEERWRLDMGLVRRRQRGKVGGLIDDRGKVRFLWVWPRSRPWADEDKLCARCVLRVGGSASYSPLNRSPSSLPRDYKTSLIELG